MVIAGDPATQTIIGLGYVELSGEWYTWREPVIAWVGDDDRSGLIPLVWNATGGFEAVPLDPRALHPTHLYLRRLYRAEEVPTAGELCEAAAEIERRRVRAIGDMRTRAVTAGSPRRRR